MFSRRSFLQTSGFGVGGLALTYLLQQEAAAEPVAQDLKPRSPHFPPAAKAMVHFMQNGGPSQMDLFDPKPELKRRHGEKPGDGFINTVDIKKTGTWMGSPFEFRFPGVAPLVFAVQRGQEIHAVALHTVGLRHRRLEVQHRRAFRTEFRALIQGR